MTEQATFQHGGVVYPVTSSGTSALKDADPALYYLLDYVASVLQSYMGARLVAEAAKEGLTNIAAAVGYQLPYDPRTVRLSQAIGKWPLLAIWRESQKYRWRTVCRMETQSVLRIAYLLPPLTPAQRERLLPLLNSVPKIILNRIENKFDPAYAAGANVLALAGIDEVDTQDDGWGSYEIAGNADDVLAFPAWFGSLFLVERDEDLPAGATGGPFAGADIEIDDVSGGGPVEIVADAATVPDPTAISGFRSLYRSDKGVTADASGSLASAWATQGSGAGGALSAAAGHEPFVLEDSETGRAILRVDARDQSHLTGTDAALASDGGKTIVAAFRLTDAAARSSIAAIVDNGSARISIEANTASSAGGLLGFAAGDSSYDTQFPATLDWAIVVFRVSATTGGSGIAASVKMQIGDEPAVLTQKSGTGNWVSMSGANAVGVGGDPSALSATNARADVGVVAIYDAELSDTDVATCVAFCKNWLAGIG